MISTASSEINETKTSMRFSCGLGAAECGALVPPAPKTSLTASLILKDETCCIKPAKLLLMSILEIHTSERFNG
jgi:hypothetical protein